MIYSLRSGGILDRLLQAPKGSVLGGGLLIAGCSMGAAMLGLPVVCARAGFIPSTFFFIIAWLFMTTTALLLLEVTLSFKGEVNIVTITRKTLGNKVGACAWLLYLFIFYCLLVAYITGSGQLISGFAADYGFGVKPEWASLLFTTLFGFFIFWGTKAVDYFNRFLMAGFVISYLGLVGFGLQHVHPELLLHHDWSATVFVMPTMVISFGFHNLIPSLSTYFGHDTLRLRKTVIFGSLAALLAYLVWQIVILGIVPWKAFQTSLASGDMASYALKSVIDSPLVGGLVQHFAFFAIVTSFLGVGLSFVDFLADALRVKKDKKGSFLLCFLSFSPPFLCGFYYPNLFLNALNYAGAFGTVFLFGVIPVLMVWRERYVEKRKGEELVMGGKPVLVGIFCISFIIFFIQFLLEMGFVRG